MRVCHFLAESETAGDACGDSDKVPRERGLFSDDFRQRSVAPFGPSSDEMRTQTALQYVRRHREEKKMRTIWRETKHEEHTRAHSQHCCLKSDAEAGGGGEEHRQRGTCLEGTPCRFSHLRPPLPLGCLSIGSHSLSSY